MTWIGFNSQFWSKSWIELLSKLLLKWLELVVELILVQSFAQMTRISYDQKCGSKFLEKFSSQLWSKVFGKVQFSTLIKIVVTNIWEDWVKSILVQSLIKSLELVVESVLIKSFEKTSVLTLIKSFWKSSILSFDQDLELIIESVLFKDPCSNCGSMFLEKSSSKVWSKINSRFWKGFSSQLWSKVLLFIFILSSYSKFAQMTWIDFSSQFWSKGSLKSLIKILNWFFLKILVQIVIQSFRKRLSWIGSQNFEKVSVLNSDQKSDQK